MKPTEPEFQNIVNWRDVGQNYNLDTQSKRLKPLNLFRSGRLDDASTLDLELLTHKYNIACVLDLRSETEGRMSDNLINTFPAAAISEALDVAKQLKEAVEPDVEDAVIPKVQDKKNTKDHLLH
jgi:hypothetical protein